MKIETPMHELDIKYQDVGRDQFIALCETAEQEYNQERSLRIDLERRVTDLEAQNKHFKDILAHLHENGQDCDEYTEAFGHSISEYIEDMDKFLDLGILNSDT